MLVTLNIGLSGPSGLIPVTKAIDALLLEGFWIKIDSRAVVNSDTEPTLVVTVSKEGNLGSFDAICRVSAALEQDCIAVWDGMWQKGYLLGPRAAAWGKFNPEFFFLKNGARLKSSELVK